jgi:hypothetical protein
MQQSFHLCLLHLYSLLATYNKQLHKVTRAAVLTRLALAIKLVAEVQQQVEVTRLAVAIKLVVQQLVVT